MQLTKKTLITLVCIAVVSILVFGAAAAGNSQQSVLPEQITEDSECPVAGCTSDEGCHVGAEPPELKEGQTMRCPKVGCASSSCHAEERLTDHYLQPKSTSLYLWIVGIPAFIIAILLITRRK